MTDIDTEIRVALAEIDAFIAHRGLQAVKNISAPNSYSIKSSSEAFNKGWVTGFRRCLAELQRGGDK